MSNTFITSSRKSWLVETKSVSLAYCISIGSPSCTSAVGVDGNLRHICWGTISKAAVNVTGLKQFPCGTPMFDSKGLPIMSLVRTLTLVLDSRVVAICMMLPWLPCKLDRP